MNKIYIGDPEDRIIAAGPIIDGHRIVIRENNAYTPYVVHHQNMNVKHEFYWGHYCKNLEDALYQFATKLYNIQRRLSEIEV